MRVGRSAVRRVRDHARMPEVLLAGRSVPYILVRNRRSRHVRMTLTPEGLRVSAPPRLPQAEVDRAVLSKERWLLRHADMLAPAAAIPLRDGALLPFLDGTLELGVRQSVRPSVRLRADEGRMSVAAPDPGAVRALVERAYRDAARGWLALMCEHHAERMAVTHGRISVRDPSTRWGSCSTRGTLSFSWRLMMAPERVAEYVVVHELSHLIHMDHSPAFWAVVARYAPHHAADVAWLRENGPWLARAPGHGARPAAPA